MTEIWEESYHGWAIQAVQADKGYLFNCWMPEQQMGVTDMQYYQTLDQAFRAGRLRADLESVRLSLTTFLRGNLQLLLLGTEEKNALESSIARYIDTAKHQFS